LEVPLVEASPLVAVWVVLQVCCSVIRLCMPWSRLSAWVLASRSSYSSWSLLLVLMLLLLLVVVAVVVLLVCLLRYRLRLVCLSSYLSCLL
jgi:heme/copper-type cytochrome/quinol oxidase subunit 2